MSKDHKILYNQQMVPAERFLAVSPAVQKVAYRGETLYNVLLDNHQIMNVNGLQCETLHPENAIACLYKNNFSKLNKPNAPAVSTDKRFTRQLTMSM